MITIHASNLILDNLFGQTAIQLPATYYIGLSTTSIQNTGGGVTEPSGMGYARIGVANNKIKFTVSANGELSNTEAVQFPDASAQWGTIVNVFVADALTGGNIWYYDALQTPRLVQSGATLIFLANALKFKITNS